MSAKVIPIDPDLPPLTKKEMAQAELSLLMDRYFWPRVKENARGWKALLDEFEGDGYGFLMPIEQCSLLLDDHLGELEILWLASSDNVRKRIIARLQPLLELMEKNRRRAEAHIRKHAERAAKGAR
jgi:hypothetical protein